MLSRCFAGQGKMLDKLGDVETTLQWEGEKMRRHLHTLLTDVGSQIRELTNDQMITRMSLLQAFYEIRETYLQTHEQVMLSHQQERGLLERILEAVEMTEPQKESKRNWKRAELLRKEGKFDDALSKLREAYELDDLSPLVHLSTGTIHNTLGNSEKAALAFASADELIENNPQMSVYVLMNLASSLHDMGRHEHAERAMRKATKLSPGNPEVWFMYAKSAWKCDKKDDAIRVLKTLLATHSSLYRARIVIDPELEDAVPHLSLS